MIAHYDHLNKKGWTRLPYQFSVPVLDRLTALNIHEGRGRRLSDMVRLHELLPQAFKNELRRLDFNPVPNRAVGFVKSKDKNWSLPWHQDRVIAMPRKLDSPAYENWSQKSGVWHCEPKTETNAPNGFHKNRDTFLIVTHPYCPEAAFSRPEFHSLGALLA